MTDLKDNATYIIMNSNTSRVIETLSYGGETSIHTYRLNNGSNQKWTATRMGNSGWAFKNNYYDGTYLGYSDSQGGNVITVPNAVPWFIISPAFGILSDGNYLKVVELPSPESAFPSLGSAAIKGSSSTAGDQSWVFSEVLPS